MNEINYEVLFNHLLSLLPNPVLQDVAIEVNTELTRLYEQGESETADFQQLRHLQEKLLVLAAL